MQTLAALAVAEEGVAQLAHFFHRKEAAPGPPGRGCSLQRKSLIKKCTPLGASPSGVRADDPW